MNEEQLIYDAFTVRDEIGCLADSDVTDKKYLQVIRDALYSPCKTSDKGLQIFVVDLKAVNQLNVDTEELIWPVDPSRDCIQNDEIPLNAIINKDLWVKLEELWKEKDPIAWTAFVWRIAAPLANKLNVISSWSLIMYPEL